MHFTQKSNLQKFVNMSIKRGRFDIFEVQNEQYSILNKNLKFTYQSCLNLIFQDIPISPLLIT